MPDATSSWKPVNEDTQQENSAWKPVDTGTPASEAPPSATSRFMGNALRGFGVTDSEGAKNFFRHPIDTLGAILNEQGELGKRAGREFKSGDYLGGLTHGAEYLLPGIGPSLARSGDQLQSGDIAGGLGTMTGTGAAVGAGKAFGKLSPAGIATAGTGGELSRLGVPKSTSLPPETAARGMTRAIAPPQNEWNSHIEATQNEAGNIKDFALRNKLPLKTQLDWANAAKAAADEANQLFHKQFLAPVENEPVSTAGAGYRGEAVGENQNNARLGAINDRIIQINKELNPNYIKRETGQVRSAEANDAELTAEKNALTKILHRELSTRTGIPEDQIASLRQRLGRQYTIADQTRARVNARELGVAQAGEGNTMVPYGKIGLLSKGVNKLRGGPEGISNRAFRGALGRMGQIPATELPTSTPAPPSVMRGVPAWQMRQRLGMEPFDK